MAAIQYDRRGNGPLLLCHPGGPGFSGAEFGDLAGLGATRTLLLLHPRGTQQSGPADSYALDDYVADLEELRVSLGEEEIDLLGYSHGGMVAAAYAAAHPDRVRKLVFASSLLAVTDEMTAEAERVLASKSGEPWHEAAMAALAREEAADYESPEDLARMWNDMAPAYFSQWDERYRPQVEVDWAAPEPLKEFNAAIPDLREAARGITAPTLVLTGRDDFICGPAAAEAAAGAIPNAEVVLIDGAGHFTFLEQPGTFRDTVESFLGTSA
jgi:pimeloyl-ACP methyl ester carboxylesterase